MIEDIRVVEWAEDVEIRTGHGEERVTVTKERYDIQVKYHGADVWVPLQRVAREDVK